MKTCPGCAAENDADSKFCSACGGVLVPGPEATVDHTLPKNASASAVQTRLAGGISKPLC